MGLGNKSNGGRINRLWRGRRRRRWFAAVQAQPAPAPPLPPNPPLGFGPLVGEPFDSFAPPAGGFGPLDGETFDTQAGGFGPLFSESYDLPPGFGPLLGDIYETSAGKGFGPLDANDLYSQETVAFSQPARSLVPGRAYTRSSTTTPRQLDTVAANLTVVAGSSFQLASLPITDGDVLFTSIELECTAGVGITVDAVVRVTDQDGNVMIPPTTTTNLRLAGDVFSLLARGLTRVLAQNLVSGAVLLLVVDTPATGTTLTVTARAIGFPV